MKDNRKQVHFDEDSTATYHEDPLIYDFATKQIDQRSLSPWAGFAYNKNKFGSLVGGLKGYKGGAVFQPDDKTANVENPSAIII